MPPRVAKLPANGTCCDYTGTRCCLTGGFGTVVHAKRARCVADCLAALANALTKGELHAHNSYLVHLVDVLDLDAQLLRGNWAFCRNPATQQIERPQGSSRSETSLSRTRTRDLFLSLTQWSSSSDSSIGTVAHLRDLLIKTILPAERNKEQHDGLPTEAQPPQSVPKKLQKLGTIDVDAIEIEKKSLFSDEELKVKVEAAMLRRVQAGIAVFADDVEKLQPQLPPPFNQELVGKRLEVCWKYFQQDTGDPILIWTSGTVKRVADGLTNKRSPRARAILPGGALLWAWDEDSQFNEKAGEQLQSLILLPSKCNPSRACVYGWRYDPSELR